MPEAEEKLEQVHMGRLVQALSHEMKRKGCSISMIEDDELTSMQKHVIKFILLESMHRELYQKDVEKEFRIRKSTASEMLTLLEKKGFLVRESAEGDARLKRLVPQEKARRLLPRILSHIEQSEAQLTEGIPDADVNCCKRVLLLMLQNVSKNQKEVCKEDE